MYQYLPHVAGVSLSPQAHNGAQADAPAHTPVATPQAPSGAATVQTSADPAAKQAAAPEARGPDTGFLHKEASLARRARAQMISAEPKPTTLGWRMAVDRLTDTLQQMERAISSAQIKPPVTTAVPAPLPAMEAMKSAERVTAFFEDQHNVQAHPARAETAIAISVLHANNGPAMPALSAEPSAAPVPPPTPASSAIVVNAFVEREERAAARAAAQSSAASATAQPSAAPAEAAKQLVDQALTGYAQPPFEPAKPSDS